MKKILCSLLMLSLLLNHGVVAFAETLNSTSDSTSKQQSESNDLDAKKQYSNVDVSTDLNKSKDNTNVSDSKSEQQSESNDLDVKKQHSNADVSTDLNKSKDNTNVSDSKNIQEVDRNTNDTSIIPYDEGDDAVGWNWRGHNVEWFFNDHLRWLLDKAFEHMEISNIPNVGTMVSVPLPGAGEHMDSHNGRSLYDIAIARIDWGLPSLDTGDSSLTGTATITNNDRLEIFLNKNKNAVIDSKKIKLKFSVPRLDSTVYVDKGWTNTFQYFARQAESTINLNIKINNSYELLKDVTLRQGEKFDPNMPFDLVTDDEGKSLLASDPLIRHYKVDGVEGKEIDTSKPGEHVVEIGVLRKGNIIYGSNKARVTVKEDKTKAELKDTELYVGQKWDLGSVFKNVVDKDGNPIKPENVEWVWVDGKEKVREIDTSKPGKHTVSIAVLNAQNKWVYSNKITVTVKEDKTKAELKDTELYVGQKWNLGSVFKNVVDKDGNPIKPENVEFVWIDGKRMKELDTSKPGKHKVQYCIYISSRWIYTNICTVTVKEDKTKAELKDTKLYIGQKWNLGSVFKNVIDKDGNPIKPEDVEFVWIDEKKTKEIDTSKAGVHKVRIALLNTKNQWVYSNETTVTVKEDKTKVELKDIELYVGQKWDLGSVFKNVVDKDGNPIKPENVEWVWVDGKKKVREIDTSKAGAHKVKIALLNAKNQWVYSNEVTVTIKEEPFTVKKIPYFDFGDHVLELTNKLAVNKKENPTIELETPSIVGKDWQLQVELSPFLDKKNKKNILKGVNLFIPKGKLESDLEKEEPNQYECQLEANGKASILMSGMKTKGKGHWKNKLETKGITLSIPSENKTGDFESTLHWTLLDVPNK